MSLQRDIYVTDDLVAAMDSLACDQLLTALKAGAFQPAMKRYCRTPNEIKAFLQGARAGMVFLLGSLKGGDIELKFMEIVNQG